MLHFKVIDLAVQSQCFVRMNFDELSRMNRKIYQAKAMGQIIWLMLYDIHQLNECIQQGDHWFDDYQMLPQIVDGFVEARIYLGFEEIPGGRPCDD